MARPVQLQRVAGLLSIGSSCQVSCLAQPQVVGAWLPAWRVCAQPMPTWMGTLREHQAAGPAAEAHPSSSNASISASASAAADTSNAGPHSAEGSRLVYTGFFSKPHKRLKLASLVNTAVTLAASPIILMQQDVSALARVSVAVSLVGFGLLTTGGLHWFTSPYVHELQFSPSSKQVTAKTLKLLGGHRVTTFGLDEVQFPDNMRPLATFKARGQTFYVDAKSFADQDLLQWLTPENPAAVELARMQQEADAAAHARAAAEHPVQQPHGGSESSRQGGSDNVDARH